MTNTVNGGDGDDTFAGWMGEHLYDGGEGYDTVDYSVTPGPQGVMVNVSGHDHYFGMEVLNGVSARDGWGHLDTLWNIERVVTGGTDDTVWTSWGRDVDAGAGDDKVGWDVSAYVSDVDLGSGHDILTVDAEWTDQAVTLTSATQAADGGWSGFASIDGFARLNFTGAERLFAYGGNAADAFQGFDGADILHGGLGADTLHGAAGDDNLRGGGGADILLGGLGFDTANYLDAIGGVSIVRVYADGLIQGYNGDTSAAAGDALGDVYDDGIEAWHLSGYGDRFTVADHGRLSSETVYDGGAAGSDTIETWAGDDYVTLTGANLIGTGYKTAALGSGEDRISFDLQASTAHNFITGAGYTVDGAYGELQIDGVKRAAFSGANHMVVYGGAGAEHVWATSGSDSLWGGAGDDTLSGGSGADYLNGGAGNDTFIVGESGDQIEELAGAGLDTVRTALASYVLAENVENLVGTGVGQALVGNGLNNRIVGGGGSDLMQGQDGDDTLEAGAGMDTLEGGAGRDTASWAAANSRVMANLANGYGETATGEVDFFNGVEDLEGSAFDDILIGNSGDNRLFGGAGNDFFNGGPGQDTIDGGAGVDTVNYSFASTGVKVNLLTGAAVVVGEGTEQLSGIEVIVGSAFGDVLRGGAANEELQGGDGADKLIGGAGGDRLIGGEGRDLAAYDAPELTSGVAVDLAIRGFQQTGGAGRDALSGIEDLKGSRFGDVLKGSDAANALAGDNGDDQLFGRAGNDKLMGDRGADRLNGGLGADQLFGGAGADRFVFTAVEESAGRKGQDNVRDFSRAEGDKIDLSAIDAVAGGGDDAFAFVTRFSGVAGQVRVEARDGFSLVMADLNGDRAADFTLQVTHEGTFGAADFIL